MVNKFGTRTNEAMISQPDGFSDVKLAPAPDEHAVANNNGGTGRPNAVKFEIDIRLQYTMVSDLDLMRPGDGNFWNKRMPSNFYTAKSQPHRAATGGQISVPEPK